jgi:DNA ligase D-like protein (predicted 3'-phosphoesterase)
MLAKNMREHKVRISSRFMTDKLDEYKEKRDFKRTTEPPGRIGGVAAKSLFVVQKHNASQLHYDFRLAIDGALKSWAVPKGPSTDPRDKRYAVLTEDHPLEYARFEGVIPEDEYGAGTVMVWDIGTYRDLRRDKEGLSTSESFKEGKIEVWLKGEKLSGGYALVRTGNTDSADWLLIKMDDEEADARRKPTSTQNKSVISERTLQEIADEQEDTQ